MDVKEILFELLSAPGITGAEDDAAAVASRLLSAYMPVQRDTLGSVIGEMQGEGGGVLLDAHIDQIGLFVTAVTDEGFIKVSKCGGADLRTMACHEVRVLGKEPLYGVVVSTPPHLRKGEDKGPEWEDVAIDVGLSAERARSLISPGDRVQLLGAPRELLNGRISGAALDDRAGVAAILHAVDILKEKNIRKKVTVVFSVQEESGGGGATTAAFRSDDETAIAVDVSFAGAPGLSVTETKPMGQGTLIGLAPSLTRSVSDRLRALAEECQIPYNLEPMSGRTGTNAEAYAVSRCGKKTGLLSIPIRNMHTNVEVCDLKDVEATGELLALYVEREGQA
ncbi:MAG: M20/M25/M40 family metallo-hydrolase [Clostridia bacterium]|nr:M20/M25/M40 family metallo-hydrolase [Clostridia bacterium]